MQNTTFKNIKCYNSLLQNIIHPNRHDSLFCWEHPFSLITSQMLLITDNSLPMFKSALCYPACKKQLLLFALVSMLKSLSSGSATDFTYQQIFLFKPQNRRLLSAHKKGQDNQKQTFAKAKSVHRITTEINWIS